MKNKKWLVSLLFCVLLITGCSKDAKSVVLSSGKKISKLSNYSLVIKMNIGMKSSGLEMDIPFVITTKTDNESKISKMTLAMEMYGIKISNESYIDGSGSKTITYSKEYGDTNWTKEESSEENKQNEIVNIINKGTKYEKVKSNDKNVLQYKITVSKEDFSKVLSANGAQITENIKIESDIIYDVYINAKTKELTRIYTNLKDIIVSDNEEEQITKFDMEMIFSDYNKVGSIKIPNEIITSTENE